MILEVMGKDPEDFDWVADRPGHDRRYAIDSTKLQRELGWRPAHTDFAGGLKQTIDWYVAVSYTHLIGVPAVTAFGLFMLPANVPDEASHIWQAAALLSRNGNGFDVVSCFQLGQFPSSYADYFNAMTQPTDWSSVFVCHTYLGSYYPHLYLIPGVILGFAQQTGFNLSLIHI